MSGSEFALRIALCDVVEKWKRSQEKCKYLEQCRNELAKELIRLKQVNEDLLKENAVLAASLESGCSLDKLAAGRTDPALAAHMRATGQFKAHSPLLSASSGEQGGTRHPDGDVDQITQRLLHELKEKVTEASLKSANGTPAAGVAGDDEITLTEEQEAGEVAGNNSLGSELVVGSQPNGGCEDDTQRADHASCKQRRRSGSQHSTPAITSPPQQRLRTQEAGVSKSRQIGGRDDGRTVVEEQRRSETRQQESDADERITASAAAGACASDEAALRVYSTLVAAVTADLNKATQRLRNQQQKLQSKQLRCYFRRHLKADDQHHGGSSGIGSVVLSGARGSSVAPNPSGSKCHFEHV